MIYLDGDIQVLDNIDHLFDSPNGYLYAVMDCFCEKTWSQSPQYKIGYCQQCPEKVRWPAEMGSPPALYFNAGMFVFEPDLFTYHDLLETLKITPPTSFAEQDFLNSFFRHVYKPIPCVYNFVMAMLWRHPEAVDLDKLKVVHYCAAGSKPWRYTGEEENMQREDIKILVKRWWEIYEDESLDYKNCRPHHPQDLISALPAPAHAQQERVKAPSAA
ncbi:Glycosyl transferase, family 8 [Corchorus olitorius]|uniref:Hexosyltransferase n=1 Tax=Corchorus olitorius TaxID=93759 RepID=A0A1R3GKI8_9ROSI|nr:Glycosyl transferase, family 8 [Corchorus olitorius]